MYMYLLYYSWTHVLYNIIICIIVLDAFVVYSMCVHRIHNIWNTYVAVVRPNIHTDSTIPLTNHNWRSW